MDFLIDFLLQAVVQFLVEVVFETLLDGIFRGLAAALRTRPGRLVLTATVGVVFGTIWGWHLAGQPHPPKLLWASLTLAVLALGLAARRRSAPDPDPARGDTWRQTLAPPWKWSTARWADFAVLNLSIAGGISLGYLVG